jgi:8-oxo-dGTP pyrophosphatase MutT (NUDIX family)
MSKLMFLCIWISIFLVPDAFAGCGAGTVLYFKFKHETYLLLADHGLSHQRDRGWSGFGGRCDGEAPAAAAARETNEETKGYYSRKEVMAKLDPQSSICVHDFTTYFLEVDYVPAEVINNYRASNTSSSYRERSPYAWVPISAIWRAIENRKSSRMYLPAKYLPPEAHTDWLFEPFVTSLLAAKSGGILPWQP